MFRAAIHKNCGFFLIYRGRKEKKQKIMNVFSKIIIIFAS